MLKEDSIFLASIGYYPKWRLIPYSDIRRCEIERRASGQARFVVLIVHSKLNDIEEIELEDELDARQIAEFLLAKRLQVVSYA